MSGVSAPHTVLVPARTCVAFDPREYAAVYGRRYSRYFLRLLVYWSSKWSCYPNLRGTVAIAG